MGQPYLGEEEELTPAIGGVIVAAVTPRRKDKREVDVAAALELIDFLCSSGVHGIALLGSTGEFLNLSFDERSRFTYMAAKRSRVPMLVGVGHSSLDGAVELAREAVGSGAAGLLLMPPYFFRYDQDDIREFYLRFAEAVGGSAKIYLYNIPFFTNELKVETAIDLLSTGQFAGIKDSSGDPNYFAALKQATQLTILIGNDAIFTPCRRAGANGVVSGVACAVPELLLTLDRLICNGGDTSYPESQLQEFIARINHLPVPIGIKAAVEQRGLKVGPPAVPLSPANQKVLEEFQSWFHSWVKQW